MGDHTRPLTAFDEELQIPMIWRHPGRIPAGKTSEVLISNYDFLPTLVSYLGLKDRTSSPGRDFTPTLRGDALPGEQEVFYEFENTRAIRTSDWKLILRRFPKGPDEFYDLKADPEEARNLVDDPAHAGTRDALTGRLEKFFNRVADPQYDLWRGGRSKVKRIVPP